MNKKLITALAAILLLSGATFKDDAAFRTDEDMTMLRLSHTYFQLGVLAAIMTYPTNCGPLLHYTNGLSDEHLWRERAEVIWDSTLRNFNTKSKR